MSRHTPRRLMTFGCLNIFMLMLSLRSASTCSWQWSPAWSSLMIFCTWFCMTEYSQVQSCNQIKAFMCTFQSLHSNCSGLARKIHKPVSLVDQSKLPYLLYTDHNKMSWLYNAAVCLPWPTMFRSLKFLARIIDPFGNLFSVSCCTLDTYWSKPAA